MRKEGEGRREKGEGRRETGQGKSAMGEEIKESHMREEAGSEGVAVSWLRGESH